MSSDGRSSMFRAFLRHRHLSRDDSMLAAQLERFAPSIPDHEPVAALARATDTRHFESRSDPRDREEQRPEPARSPREGHDDFSPLQPSDETNAEALALLREGEMDGEPVFQCLHEKCGREFPRRWHALDHIRRVHLDVRRFVCDGCGRRYKQKGSLLTHSCNPAPGPASALAPPKPADIARNPL
mmetsp:Transcript_9134/g.24076  ORF Transcript_9134/g.24076 Transcript_9134/m.24076 type:complete len:185 (+) Transcript_9134:960-1514(+)